MWRILNGLSKGLRSRNQAVPSHATKWTDDNESTTTGKIEISEGNSELENFDTINHPTSNVLLTNFHHQIRQNHTSCKHIQIRKRTSILQTRSFGLSSGRDYGTEGHYSHRRSDEPYLDGILNGIMIGITWMTFFFFERRYLTYFQQLCQKEMFLTWKEHLQDDNNSWKAKLLINKFHLPYNTTILAAGGEEVGARYVRTLNPSPIVPVVLAKGESDGKYFPATSRQKSVTFDKETNSNHIMPPGSSSCSFHTEPDSLFSEELLEEFKKTNRQCAGATFNILGLQQVHLKNYKQAYHYFKCGSGELYGKSLYNLAICYQEGFGTVKNIAKAMRMYERASYYNHPLAQYNLAQLLLQRGNAADVSEALRLLEKAASNGLSKSMVALGVYFAKPGPNQNYKKSVKMFKNAIEHGDVEAKYCLGICYEHGLGGLRKDLSAAYDLYSSASSCGHLNARYNLAVILEVGCAGVDININMAIQLYLSASKLGHKESASRLKEFEKQNKKIRCDDTGIGQDNSKGLFTIIYTEGKTKSCSQLPLPSPKFDHVVCFEKNS